MSLWTLLKGENVYIFESYGCYFFVSSTMPTVKVDADAFCFQCAPLPLYYFLYLLHIHLVGPFHEVVRCSFYTSVSFLPLGNNIYVFFHFLSFLFPSSIFSFAVANRKCVACFFSYLSYTTILRFGWSVLARSLIHWY